MGSSKRKPGSIHGHLAVSVALAVSLLRPAPCIAFDKPEHVIFPRVVFWLLKGPQYAKIAADASWSLDTNEQTSAWNGVSSEDIPNLARDYLKISARPDDEAMEYALSKSQIGMQQTLHALMDKPLDPENLATFRQYIRDELNRQNPEDRVAVQAVLLGWYSHYLLDGFPGVHPPIEVIGHALQGKVPDLSFYNPDTASEAANFMFREILHYFRETNPKEAAAIEQRLADQLGPDWSTRVSGTLDRVALGVAAGYDADRLFKFWDNTEPTTTEFNRAVQNAQKVMDNALTGPRADTFNFKDKPDVHIGIDDHMDYRVGGGNVSIFYSPPNGKKIRVTVRDPRQAFLDNPKTRQLRVDSLRRKLPSALLERIGSFLLGTPTTMKRRDWLRDGRGVAAQGSSPTGKRIVTVDRRPKAPTVGGVRLAYDTRLLSQAWALEGFDGKHRLIRELAGRLKDPAKESEVLADFANRVRSRIKARTPRQEHHDLAVVSLQALLERVEPYRDRWGDLPVGLRTPGRLGRVHGFVVSPDGNDLLIVGSRSADDQALDLDDLIVAVQSVWKVGGAPTCSLDPDPEDLVARRVGPQKSRIIEVPRDCGFARAMLDADYSMKKILLGKEKVNVRGFTPLIEILEKSADPKLASRFWFYPSPLRPGDVQVAGDGQAALFDAGLEVRTEHIVVGRAGLEGTGQTDLAAERTAASLNEHFAAVAREQPHFRRLRALNDLVTLCVLWRELGVRSSLLDRLTELPYHPVEVPSSYPGLIANHAKGAIFGGVQLKSFAGSRSWLVLDDAELGSLRALTSTKNFADQPGADLSGLRVHLPRPRVAVDLPGSGSAAAIAKLDAEDFDGALAEAQRLLEADPADPLPLIIRSVVHLARGEVSSARRAALLAGRLDPGNSSTIAYVADVLGYSSALMSHDAASIVPGKGLVITLNDKEAALLRGTALLHVGQGVGARKNLERAMELDPQFALAQARLALLESSQGELVKAKKLARRARTLSPNSVEVTAVLAFTEIKLHHLATAETLAREVLNHPACDQQSRALAFKALVGAEAARAAWGPVKEHLTAAAKCLPEIYQISLVCYAAEQAELLNRRDLAAEFARITEGLAPDPILATPATPVAPATAPADVHGLPAPTPPDRSLWLWLAGGTGLAVLVGLAFWFGRGRGKLTGTAQKGRESH